ncbi:MAG TPA: hypothetical protein VGI83_07485, partial [Gemmatimonadales bacterium]
MPTRSRRSPLLLAVIVAVTGCAGGNPPPRERPVPAVTPDPIATAAATATPRVIPTPADPAEGVTAGRFDLGKMWTFE